MNKKVNLFLVGAAKSGTTSIAKYLEKEIQVNVPLWKEPFFFVKDYGEENFDKYHDLYDFNHNYKYYLDASTGYLFDPIACEKIREYNPNAKVVIILRNPIDFMLSYWEYMCSHGKEKSSFIEAISERELVFRKTDEFKTKCKIWPPSYWYKERAMYYGQVKQYLSCFDHENIKILIFEDLIKNKSSLIELFDFLKIESSQNYEIPRSNKSGKEVLFVKWIRFSPSLSLIKSVTKKILGRNISLTIRSLLFKVGATQKGYEKEVLKQSDREFLKSILTEDVRQLKKLLPDLDFSSWKDFN
jgi:hypothetical protein